MCHANVNVNLMEENVTQINEGIMINVDVSVKDIMHLATCYCENGKYLASIMDDSAIMRDEITDTEAKSNKEETKTNFNGNNANCKMQNFYILLAFLLISIGLLIAVSIYCYLIKYRPKQLLPFHYTNNELREVLY